MWETLKTKARVLHCGKYTLYLGQIVPSPSLDSFSNNKPVSCIFILFSNLRSQIQTNYVLLMVKIFKPLENSHRQKEITVATKPVAMRGLVIPLHKIIHF